MNFDSRLAALVTTAFATTLCATSVLAAGDVPSGDGFQQLHSFTHYSDPQGPFGESPNSPLLKASNGHLYGTTCDGGVRENGSLYSLSSSGQYKLVHSFKRTVGTCPQGPLVQASDGNLYGVAYGGGQHDRGTVFRYDLKGHVTVLHAFARGQGGSHPSPGLVQARDGNLYGMATGREGELIYRLGLDGTYTPIYSLDVDKDGYFAVGGIMVASDGNLYGETLNGGQFGHGALFRVSLAGQESIVHAFGSGDDIQSPRSGLAEGPDHALYGTSHNGGANGQGGLFRQELAGAYAVLASYDDATGPSDITPAIGVDGDIYVATYLGWILRFDATGLAAGSYLLPSGSSDAYLSTNGRDWLIGVDSSGGKEGAGYVFKLDATRF